MNTLFKNLISFFYPVLCPACGNALQQKEQIICLDCLLHLPETDYYLDRNNPMSQIFTGRIDIETVSALLFYKKGNLVQNLLHHLKYKGNEDVGIFLGDYYGRKLITIPEYQKVDFILPIPLHPKKLKMRGYNQSEAIAKGLAQGMNIPYYTDLLIRSIFTDTQTKKNRFNRWENVKEVFEVTDYEIIKGKTVLLCDDVLTTGATIEGAAQKLLHGENVTVFVVTLATAL